MNSNRNDYEIYRTKSSSTSVSSFMSTVYMWMMAGLALSGFTAYMVASSPQAIQTIFGNSFMYIVLFLLQLGAVFWLSARVQYMSLMFAGSLFLGYSILTGLTFSVFFVVFSMQSIASAFFVTAFGFFGLSLIGYVTKRDLGPVGSFCTIGLFGFIALALLSMFIPAMRTSAFSMMMNVVGILIFAGLTAYDTQKLKNYSYAATGEAASKNAIVGALTLYLDFINLFMFILNIFGDRR
jgi:uncharacterized protein